MNETHLTVVGTVCTNITPKRVGADGRLVVSFRVASNERRRDRETGDWGDGDSFYVQVSCWRRLADNVLASLVIGDPVVVTGRLYTRSWETEGEKRSVVNLEASSVGVDLSRYRAVVVRQKDRPVYDTTAAVDAEDLVGTAPPGDEVVVGLNGDTADARVLVTTGADGT